MAGGMLYLPLFVRALVEMLLNGYISYTAIQFYILNKVEVVYLITSWKLDFGRYCLRSIKLRWYKHFLKSNNIEFDQAYRKKWLRTMIHYIDTIWKFISWCLWWHRFGINRRQNLIWSNLHCLTLFLKALFYKTEVVVVKMISQESDHWQLNTTFVTKYNQAR
jgi:hypothetical protein